MSSPASLALPAPRGLAATRVLRALAIAEGDPISALAFAEGAAWADTPRVVEHLRGLVDPVASTDAEGFRDAVSRDFSEAVRAQSIIGRLAGVRRVPFDVAYSAMTSGARASFTGEGRPTPVSAPAITGAALGYAKVQAAVVASRELLRAAGPAGEASLRRDLVGACAAALDRRFVDPAAAAVLGVSPASITHGAGSTPSTGASVAQVDADLAAALDALEATGSTMEFATWILHSRTAARLARLRTTGGGFAFPGLSVKGGTLLGLPAITSASVPVTLSTAATTTITLVDASEVLLADDGGSIFDTATQGSIQSDSSPTAGAHNHISLWQQGLVALRATRFTNWALRRPYVQTIVGVPY